MQTVTNKTPVGTRVRVAYPPELQPNARHGVTGRLVQWEVAYWWVLLDRTTPGVLNWSHIPDDGQRRMTAEGRYLTIYPRFLDALPDDDNVVDA